MMLVSNFVSVERKIVVIKSFSYLFILCVEIGAFQKIDHILTFSPIDKEGSKNEEFRKRRMTSIIGSTALIHHHGSSSKQAKILPENVNCGGINSSFSWKVLANPKPCCPLFSYYISKVRYLASSYDNNAVVFIETYNGVLMPQQAFFVSENIVYVLDSPTFPGRDVTIPLVLYRNPTIYCILEENSCSKLTFTTFHLASFLFCIDENALVTKMLQLDGCYIALDKYILAMGFVYLIRIGFNPPDFSATTILAACMIAHKMEEDLYPGLGFLDLFKSSLPTNMSSVEKNSTQRKVIEAHTTILKSLNFRCWVDKKVCLQVIECAPNHPVWKRSRLGFHCGAVTNSYYQWKLQCLEKAVRHAKSNCSMQLCSGGFSCCIMCLGNPRYCTNLKDRFGNVSTQLQHTTELCSVLMNSCSLQSDYSSTSSSPEFYFPLNIQTLGVDDKESSEYSQALFKEWEIEEVLIKGKRFHDQHISSSIVE